MGKKREETTSTAAAPMGPAKYRLRAGVSYPDPDLTPAKVKALEKLRQTNAAARLEVHLEAGTVIGEGDLPPAVFQSLLLQEALEPWTDPVSSSTAPAAAEPSPAAE